jgi:hypothetical protein
VPNFIYINIGYILLETMFKMKNRTYQKMLSCQFAEQAKLEEYKAPFTAQGQFPIGYV